MTTSEYKKLNNSLTSFELIKQKSEQYWEQIDLEVSYGFQIQQNSKWKKGLTDEQLIDFQKQLGIQFPESLKSYYKTMNGLDKPGLDNNGGKGEIEFGPIFYSYPDDIEEIRSNINWILEANTVTKEVIIEQNVPLLFPYLGHRFLVLNKEQRVLSMHGRDIIYWAYNLSKGIARDIFPFFTKGNLKELDGNSFWNKKVLLLEQLNSKSF